MKMVTVEDAFRFLGNGGPESELAVNQRKIAQVFAIAFAAIFFLIVAHDSRVPKDVEGVEEWIAAPEQELIEL
jgi:hypothetical protein